MKGDKPSDYDTRCIAFKQHWKCIGCRKLLPPTIEISLGAAFCNYCYQVVDTDDECEEEYEDEYEDQCEDQYEDQYDDQSHDQYNDEYDNQYQEGDDEYEDIYR